MTLEPVAPAIVWQDRRSSGICESLRKGGYSEIVRDHTGLVIDPYFSATKIMWLLEKYPKLRKMAQAGEICFGTVDSYLAARLTDGEIHVTDLTNASRTMLFDINTLSLDDELLRLFKIPSEILPEVRPSSHYFGETNPKHFGKKLAIGALIGDQQASLIGHAIFKPGIAKNTYGTGCFLLAVTGNQRIFDRGGHLLSTIAWGDSSGVKYALEGSVLSAGSTLQWLHDGLRITDDYPKFSKSSKELGKNDDVYLVPALSGLGAPFWDERARGLILGITAGTTRRHVVRAALEAICYQSADVLFAMEDALGYEISVLRVDGGASKNNHLMQFQADIAGKIVERSRITETTSLGAAFIAELTFGICKNLDHIKSSCRPGKEFTPRMDTTDREKLYGKWKDAVSRAKSWSRD